MGQQQDKMDGDYFDPNQLPTTEITTQTTYTKPSHSQQQQPEDSSIILTQNDSHAAVNSTSSSSSSDNVDTHTVVHTTIATHSADRSQLYADPCQASFSKQLGNIAADTQSDNSTHIDKQSNTNPSSINISSFLLKDKSSLRDGLTNGLLIQQPPLLLDNKQEQKQKKAARTSAINTKCNETIMANTSPNTDKPTEPIQAPTNSTSPSSLDNKDKPYTIPPAVAADVLKEMMANKPDSSTLQKVESPHPGNVRKSDAAGNKFKLKNDGSSRKHDASFPSKFSFPNIADKNFFVPNFVSPSSSTTCPTGSPPSFGLSSFSSSSSAHSLFSFANYNSEASSKNPFQTALQAQTQSSSLSSTQSSPTDMGMKLMGLSFAQAAMEETSPPTLTRSLQETVSRQKANVPSSPNAQKSSSHLFFPNFNGSFDFDLPSKNAEEVRVSADGIATVIGVRDGSSTQSTRGNGGKK